uniref:Uncharacterized protein n=1 Tax=Chelonoidis abingdonii TaxID=106734 RepID=A0A8C0IYQ0_CHEAB
SGYRLKDPVPHLKTSPALPSPTLTAPTPSHLFTAMVPTVEEEIKQPPLETFRRGLRIQGTSLWYNEHEPTPLPNGTELAEVIEKVVCAQRKSASGKVLCIFTKSSKCVLVNTSLIIHSFLSWFRYQNALIKVFPSLLSQTLYTCFCSSFPRSWFNTDEFKSQLCNVLSEWMAGTLPVPGSYSNWDYSHLEPERFRREDLLSTKGKQSTTNKSHTAFSKLNTRHDGTYLHRKWNPSSAYMDRFHCISNGYIILHSEYESYGALHALSFGIHFDIINSLFSFVSSPLQSHPACQGPDFTWHLFNINGHSPLIQHFLQSYNVEPQSGQDILIHRREICKPIPYPYDQLRNIRDGKIVLGHILSIPQECRIISYSILLNFFSESAGNTPMSLGMKESVNAPSPNPPSVSQRHDPDWPSLGVMSEEELGGEGGRECCPGPRPSKDLLCSQSCFSSQEGF